MQASSCSTSSRLWYIVALFILLGCLYPPPTCCAVCAWGWCRPQDQSGIANLDYQFCWNRFGENIGLKQAVSWSELQNTHCILMCNMKRPRSLFAVGSSGLLDFFRVRVPPPASFRYFSWNFCFIALIVVWSSELKNADLIWFSWLVPRGIWHVIFRGCILGLCGRTVYGESGEKYAFPAVVDRLSGQNFTTYKGVLSRTWQLVNVDCSCQTI